MHMSPARWDSRKGESLCGRHSGDGEGALVGENLKQESELGVATGCRDSGVWVEHALVEPRAVFAGGNTLVLIAAAG